MKLNSRFAKWTPALVLPSSGGAKFDSSQVLLGEYGEVPGGEWSGGDVLGARRPGGLDWLNMIFTIVKLSGAKGLQDCRIPGPRMDSRQ